MTKTYTEQWREGTLPKGWYYVKTYCEEIKKLYCGDGESLELDDPETSAYYFYHRENGKGQVEILAPVPSYDENNELVQKMHILEKRLEVSEKEHYRTLEQLRIATKALKKIIRDYEINGIGYLCVTRAKEALKKMEGVK